MKKESNPSNSPTSSARLEKKIRRLAIWLGGFAILCGITAILFYVSKFNGSLTTSHDRWGQFGDFFGGTLNPIFGLLSLVAILITLFFQAKELSNSTEALQEQASHLELQAFESTFFSMVSMHNENLKGLDLDETEKEKYTGRSVFRIVYRRLLTTYKNSSGTDELAKTTGAYDDFYKKNQRFIGHYLATLNQIFDFIIDRCKRDQEDYWQFITAQLTDYELVIIFYHYLSKDTQDHLDKIVVNNVFTGIDKELLLDKDKHFSFIFSEEENGEAS